MGAVKIPETYTGSCGEIENAETEKSDRRTGKPRKGAVAAEAADASQEKHGSIQKADLLKPRLAPPGRRMQSSCHE